MIRYSVIIFLVAAIILNSYHINNPTQRIQKDNLGKGALLVTNFKSLDALKSVVQIKYKERKKAFKKNSQVIFGVKISYFGAGIKLSNTLTAGISESDFLRARDGKVFNKLQLLLRSPYAVLNRRKLITIEHLSRRRPWVFGMGDAAFYDLAEQMVFNISDEDLEKMKPEELSEKGYLNTFNHITAQAFMTSIFSEKLADFVADVHERHRMPELITGRFSNDQLNDLENGPVDNYIDMINNEMGQELGKFLQNKYSIHQNTFWTPQLLADFLNEIQNHSSWTFQIACKPFQPSDEMVIGFADKINSVIKKLPPSKSYY